MYKAKEWSMTYNVKSVESSWSSPILRMESVLALLAIIWGNYKLK